MSETQTMASGWSSSMMSATSFRAVSYSFTSGSAQLCDKPFDEQRADATHRLAKGGEAGRGERRSGNVVEPRHRHIGSRTEVQRSQAIHHPEGEDVGDTDDGVGMVVFHDVGDQFPGRVVLVHHLMNGDRGDTGSFDPVDVALQAIVAGGRSVRPSDERQSAATVDGKMFDRRQHSGGTIDIDGGDIGGADPTETDERDVSFLEERDSFVVVVDSREHEPVGSPTAEEVAVGLDRIVPLLGEQQHLQR